MAYPYRPPPAALLIAGPGRLPSGGEEDTVGHATDPRQELTDA